MGILRVLTLIGCVFSSTYLYAGIIPAKLGVVTDDENIKRTLVVFKNYDDAIKQPSECDTQGTEVPAYILLSNKPIPACWEPARGDGVGSFRYTNQNNEKEFSFNERDIKFKLVKFDTAKHRILR